MKLTGKKILVTGADGFIGSHLTEYLVQAGHDVKAFVYYNSFGSRGWLDTCAPEIQRRMEVTAGDIRDPFAVKNAMQGCDVVLHLAALIAIPYSYTAPHSYVDTNIHGTLNVLQAARELSVQKVVHTSTSEVYGTAQFVPITEEHPLQGQSPYSASKIAADQMAYAYCSSFDLPVAVIRPFNTYGPRQSTRAVIPTVITQIASGSRVIKLGATDPTRDFNYVEDTVRGFVAVAESDSAVGEVVNIGSNYDISIGDTVKLIAEIMNAAIEIETDQMRIRPKNSEVERLRADNTKARRLTAWEPMYAGPEGLKKGLEKTIAWFVNPENLKQYHPGQYGL